MIAKIFRRNSTNSFSAEILCSGSRRRPRPPAVTDSNNHGSCRPGAAARREGAFAGLVGRNGLRRGALGSPVIFGTVDASRLFRRAGHKRARVPDRAVTLAI